MNETRVSRHINAPVSLVYGALLDAAAVNTWMVPPGNERVVQAVEFETSDPALQGEMTITITLSATGSGTELVAAHERLPPGLRPEDNEQGWQQSLAKLAELVEKPTTT